MKTSMTKKDVQKRVTQFGKPLALSKFKWNEKTRTFSSKKNCLVIDFTGEDFCIFAVADLCSITSGSWCVFKAGYSCTFNTGWRCIFATSFHCVFRTEWGCTFNTGSGCTFTTAEYCTFDVGRNCCVIRQDIFEIIPISNEKITLCPEGVPGYIKDSIHSVTGKPAE